MAAATPITRRSVGPGAPSSLLAMPATATPHATPGLGLGAANTPAAPAGLTFDDLLASSRRGRGWAAPWAGRAGAHALPPPLSPFTRSAMAAAATPSAPGDGGWRRPDAGVVAPAAAPAASFVPDDVIVDASGTPHAIGPAFDAFHRVLAGHLGTAEPDDALRHIVATCEGWEAVCRDALAQARHRLEVPDGATDLDATAAEAQSWALEANTWNLVARLLQHRVRQQSLQRAAAASTAALTPPRPPHPYVSDTRRLRDRMDRSETPVVCAWIEAMAPPPPPTPLRKHYRPATLKALRHADRQPGSAPLVSEYDPDAPLREGKPLAGDDATYENEQLAQRIFLALRRGRLMDAIDACRACDAPWQAAVLLGSIRRRDTLLDGDALARRGADGAGADDATDAIVVGGNANHRLFKLAARAAAAEPRLGKFQRATYAVLAGAIDHALAVCQSWEDHLWVRYRARLEAEVEAALDASHAADAAAAAAEPSSALTAAAPRASEEFALARYDATPEAILADVAQAIQEDAAAVPATAGGAGRRQQHPFHEAQASLILDHVHELYGQFVDEMSAVMSGQTAMSPLFPHRLRFMAHLVLILRDFLPTQYALEHGRGAATPHGPTPLAPAERILEAYANLLVSARKNDDVALYARFLPRTAQVDLYAHFLKNVDADITTRWGLLDSARRHGLDIDPICRQAVLLTFQAAPVAGGDGQGAASSASGGSTAAAALSPVRETVIASLADPPSPMDHYLIRALEWLTASPSTYADALLQSNYLIRRALGAGKIHLVAPTLGALPRNVIDERWMDEPTDASDADSPMAASDAADAAAAALAAPTTAGSKSAADGGRTTRSGAAVAESDERTMDDASGVQSEARMMCAAVQEHVAYRQLLEALQSLGTWHAHFWQYGPASARGAVDAQGAAAYAAWQTELVAQTQRCERQLYALATSGWLESDLCRGLSRGHAAVRSRELERLRTLYMPHVVLSLQQILYETRDVLPENLDHSVRVVNLVASEEYGLYHAFLAADRLEHLLASVSQSALAQLDQQPETAWISA
ncbi:hypothetical protein CXG81DRAFT_25577 [Caulochytrium protostelioides]|uniref:Nuclear pore complex protein n=1 Tax=Caulochytrium protostelioides TaxID=1555241 RepID=A0A4P9X8U4_9FUNG|nr:hypothetical protein CXG81DRAFT_25577 [Caulochytrium protostelioides]|eukprot:RKP01737.1 hypothetical protein CXG81DRAFT_25577 [Caulochytrium protostelioides]